MRAIVEDFSRYFDDVQAAVNAGTTPPDGANLVSSTSGDIVKLQVLQLLIAALYYIPLTKLRGQTLGKMALGMRVRPLAQDGLPTWGQSVLRWVGQFAIAVLLSIVPGGGIYSLLNAAWILWDPRRQCLHDKIAKTVVARKQ